MIEQLFSKCLLYFNTTGIANKLISSIYSTQGASNCIIGTRMPYAYEDTARVLDIEKLESACNPDIAKQLAKKAYEDACMLELEKTKNINSLDKKIIGVGATGTLVTTRQKKGQHHAFICLYSSDGYVIYLINLNKDLTPKRTKAEEDDNISDLILLALANKCGIAKYNPPLLDKDLDSVSGDIIYLLEEKIFNSYYTNEWRTLFVHDSKSTENLKLPSGTIIIPGSFNPLHDGHISIGLSILEKEYGWVPGCGQVNPLLVFEFGCKNADKKDKTEKEISSIVSQFNSANPLFIKYGLTNIGCILTLKPLFVDKSNEFKNCIFGIGADTFQRIIMPKYYYDKDHGNQMNGLINMVCALSTIKNNGVKIYVAGRIINQTDIDDRIINQTDIDGRIINQTDINGRIINQTDIDGKIIGQAYETLTSLYQKEESAFFITPSIRSIFHEIEDFRIDISSTQLRSG